MIHYIIHKQVWQVYDDPSQNTWCVCRQKNYSLPIETMYVLSICTSACIVECALCGRPRIKIEPYVVCITQLHHLLSCCAFNY